MIVPDPRDDAGPFPRGLASRSLHDPPPACYTLGVSDENVRAIRGGTAVRRPDPEEGA